MLIAAPTAVPGASSPLSPAAQKPPGLEFRADTCEISMKVPQIVDPRHPEGCDAFNKSIGARFSAAQANFFPMTGNSGWLEGGGSKTFDDGHLLAVSLAFDAYSGGAHPSPWLETVLYDADQGREVALPDLFVDRSTYLQDLSREVSAQLAPQKEMDEYFISSNAGPSADNFAAFHPSAEGLTFDMPAARIGPYGPGMYQATIPWDHLRSALDPRGPLWRESAPFTWHDGDERQQCFARLVALHDSAATSPKDDPAAPQAAREFLTVSAAVDGSGATLPELTGQYAVVYDALARHDQADEAEKTFAFIETELRKGTFGAATRQEVTARLLQSLLLTGSAEGARAQALAPPDRAGTVERKPEVVVIDGIRVPVKGA